MKRTNIVIDDKLINELKKKTGLKTSKAIIDFALKELKRKYSQYRILDLKGKVKWDGNIEKMRLARGL